MANKFDLKTKTVLTDASIVTNLGGAIATGKTRFLTFIQVKRATPLMDTGVDQESIEVAVACHATDGCTHESLASEGDYAKLVLHTASIATAGCDLDICDGALVNKIKGSIENPILSVVGPNYMTLSSGSTVTVAIFAQYFDA